MPPRRPLTAFCEPDVGRLRLTFFEGVWRFAEDRHPTSLATLDWTAHLIRDAFTFRRFMVRSAAILEADGMDVFLHYVVGSDRRHRPEPFD